MKKSQLSWELMVCDIWLITMCAKSSSRYYSKRIEQWIPEEHLVNGEGRVWTDLLVI